MNANWLTPDWPAPKSVRAVFTTRVGGVSDGPYESLNLGDHVGDSAGQVAENRAILQRSIGIKPVFLKQVHGSEVLLLNADSSNNQSADACVTVQRGLACTILVADCLPVLLTTEDGAVVAAAHAGWRGLAGVGGESGESVLTSVYKSFKAQARIYRGHLTVKTIAWMGPCIGPSAFEVGPEVKAAFETAQPGAERFFVEIGGGKYLANLPALARMRLQALGITQIYGNDGSAPWCTVSNPSKFFSHRRDAGVSGNGFGTTGRLAACIWLA